MAAKKKLTESRAQWIVVVTGIIRRQNKILVGRRPEGGSLPDVWEFPGGKVEANESLPKRHFTASCKRSSELTRKLANCNLLALIPMESAGCCFCFTM